MFTFLDMSNDGPAMHLTRSYTQPPGHPVGHSPNSAFSPAARRRQLPDYEYIKNNSRFQKPSQAIYRPPLARRADESDESPSSHSSESFLPIKSALKRSLTNVVILVHATIFNSSLNMH